MTANLEQFLIDVEAEFARACAKFPQPNPVVAVMAEEAGEVAKAVLHIREGKSLSWWDVYDEAVQLAAMAARIALEGDPTVGAVPTAKNCPSCKERHHAMDFGDPRFFGQPIREPRDPIWRPRMFILAVGLAIGFFAGHEVYAGMHAINAMRLESRSLAFPPETDQ